MRHLGRLPVFILIIVSIVSLLFAAQSYAQPADTGDGSGDTNTTSPADTDNDSGADDSSKTGGSSKGDSDAIDGIELTDSAFDEVYYWDMQENDAGTEEPVIIAAGGVYDKEVVFEKSDKSPGADFETYVPFKSPDDDTLEITGWLPVRTLELEFDAKEPEACAMDKRVPLMSKGGYVSDLTINVSKYGGNAYIDIIGDSKDGDMAGVGGNDSFVLSWFIAVGTEDGKYLASAPFDLVRGIILPLDQKMSIRPYVEEAGHSSYIGVRPLVWDDYKYDVYKCEFSFKNHFNTTLSKYSIHSLDHSTISRKILGEKGERFTDWVRRINNQRDYLAIEESARKESLSQCATIENTNQCQTTLSKDFHKCYMRAIGYKTSNRTHYAFEDIPNKLDTRKYGYEWFKVSEFKHEPWMHAIRENTDAFISCFEHGPAAAGAIDVDLKSFSNPVIFKSTEESRDFAARIVDGTVWSNSINPIIGESEEDIVPGQLKTSCSLGMLGWILCPVMNLLAKIGDSMFKFLEGWLQVPPLYGNDSSAAFRAWAYLRDFGNILFTILILGIIIVQSTGGTLSGYSIRKRVPHIAITAVLINLSFVLTSAAVDASNIIGSSVIEAVHSFLPPAVETEGPNNWEKIVDAVAFAGHAVAGTAAILASLAALIPMLIVSVFSLVITLILLLLRQALVIVLVVIAPLAIATRLLPGTEQWFKKWKNLFVQMIMLYPAIALIFGGSYFASQVIMNSGSEEGGISGNLLTIFGLAIQVIPLFITPIVMKMGGQVLNSFGGKLKGAMAGSQKATVNAANGGVKYMNNRLDTLAAQGKLPIVGGIRRRKMRREGRRGFNKREIDRAKMAGSADTTVGQFITKGVGGGFNKDSRDKIAAALAAEAEKLANEDIITSRLRLEYDKDINDPNSDLDSVNRRLLDALRNKSIDPAEAAAYIDKIAGSGDIEAVDGIMEIESLPPSARRALADAVEKYRLGDNAAHYRDSSGAIEGGASVTDLHRAALARGDYSSEGSAARQSGQALESMSRHTEAFSNPEDLRNFKRAYAAAAQKEVYSKYITEANKQRVERM